MAPTALAPRARTRTRRRNTQRTKKRHTQRSVTTLTTSRPRPWRTRAARRRSPTASCSRMKLTRAITLASSSACDAPRTTLAKRATNSRPTSARKMMPSSPLTKARANLKRMRRGSRQRNSMDTGGSLSAKRLTTAWPSSKSPSSKRRSALKKLRWTLRTGVPMSSMTRRLRARLRSMAATLPLCLRPTLILQQQAPRGPTTRAVALAAACSCALTRDADAIGVFRARAGRIATGGWFSQ
mmetsp:Transcript_3448/g.13936  ORF Transcript_3448/g.13936 Transcript_3448/m.13936 type:complete len:240 (+) Transcript_3448:422-1141(+)